MRFLSTLRLLLFVLVVVSGSAEAATTTPTLLDNNDNLQQMMRIKERTTMDNDDEHQTTPRRQLQEATTTNNSSTTTRLQRRTVLPLRFLDNDNESPETTKTIESTIYTVLFQGDMNQGRHSVKHQMQLCSGGRILLEPTVHGVVTVPIPDKSSVRITADRTALLEQGARLALQFLGISTSSGNTSRGGTTTTSSSSFLNQLRQLADHVVVILPESYPDHDFLASADISNSVSVYSVAWATSLSAYMHEVRIVWAFSVLCGVCRMDIKHDDVSNTHITC